MSERKFRAIDTLHYLIDKPTIETKLVKKINVILSKSQNESSMVGIIGEEGMGKSTAIAKFISDNPNTYYVRMGDSYVSKTLFHELIFLMTGKEVYKSISMHTTIDFLSTLLTNTNEKKLIIIDDAGKLKSKGLGLFHELRDNTMATTGFAFLGLEYFMNGLIKWKKEGKVGIGEFYRRVNYWFTLPYLTEQEKVCYLKARGLDPNEKLLMFIRDVRTMWDLEAKVNIYISQKKGRDNDAQ